MTKTRKVQLCGVLMLGCSVLGVNAQRRPRPATRPPAKPTPAPTSTPLPTPTPRPLPTPPAPCSWCEPILAVLEKGARWQTIVDIDPATSSPEVQKASSGRTVAAIIFSGEDLKGEIPIERGTGIAGPVETIVLLSNRDAGNATTITNSPGSMREWMDHIAYRMELGKLYGFICFFNREEFVTGRSLKATLSARLTPEDVRQFGRTFQKPN